MTKQVVMKNNVKKISEEGGSPLPRFHCQRVLKLQPEIGSRYC